MLTLAHENTPPATRASVERPGQVKVGTVGPAPPGVAVRIAEDGEIELKGAIIFGQYGRNPPRQKPRSTTGGSAPVTSAPLNDDGFLTITGRKNEIIVTAGGKNVAPAVLEEDIRTNPLVEHVVVAGDRRPFIRALITLVVLPERFTETSSHLTPKLTVKRHAVLNPYDQDIEGIYSAAPSTRGVSLA